MIEWTDRTWNPVRGCSRVSEGCRFCYAERDAARKNENPRLLGYHGFSRFVQIGGRPVPQWTGKVELVPSRVGEPMHWRQPVRIFCNSMSDLFHEKVTDDELLLLYTVMANSHIATGTRRTHTFQVLTKRAERMRYFCARLRWRAGLAVVESELYGAGILNLMPYLVEPELDPWVGLESGSWVRSNAIKKPAGWVPPQVWLGVSVENQKAADERIRELLRTPAAVRFVSYEPALEAVDFFRAGLPFLDQLIVGGESGPGARPFDLDWGWQAQEQCRAAGVAFFMKQFGANIRATGEHLTGWPAIKRNARIDTTVSPPRILLHDRKGGDPEEWPAKFRVRQYPGEQL